MPVPTFPEATSPAGSAMIGAARLHASSQRSSVPSAAGVSGFKSLLTAAVAPDSGSAYQAGGQASARPASGSATTSGSGARLPQAVGTKTRQMADLDGRSRSVGRPTHASASIDDRQAASPGRSGMDAPQPQPSLVQGAVAAVPGTPRSASVEADSAGQEAVPASTDRPAAQRRAMLAEVTPMQPGLTPSLVRTTGDHVQPEGGDLRGAGTAVAAPRFGNGLGGGAVAGIAIQNVADDAAVLPAPGHVGAEAGARRFSQGTDADLLGSGAVPSVKSLTSQAAADVESSSDAEDQTTSALTEMSLSFAPIAIGSAMVGSVMPGAVVPETGMSVNASSSAVPGAVAGDVSLLLASSTVVPAGHDAADPKTSADASSRQASRSGRFSGAAPNDSEGPANIGAAAAEELRQTVGEAAPEDTKRGAARLPPLQSQPHSLAQTPPHGSATVPSEVSGGEARQNASHALAAQAAFSTSLAAAAATDGLRGHIDVVSSPATSVSWSRGDAASTATPSPGAVQVPSAHDLSKTGASATTTASEAPAAISPTPQIAPVLVRLASAGAPGQISIRLTPEALGRVDITITRPPEGAARIVLSVERPETLLALRNDQAALSQALDRAGIPSIGRNISIELAAQSPVLATAVTPHAAAMPAAQSLPGSDPSVQSGWLGGQSLSGNSSGQSGAQSGGHSGSQGGTGRSNPQIEADLSLTEHTSKTAARGHWTRAGLNITA